MKLILNTKYKNELCSTNYANCYSYTTITDYFQISLCTKIHSNTMVKLQSVYNLISKSNDKRKNISCTSHLNTFRAPLNTQPEYHRQ